MTDKEFKEMMERLRLMGPEEQKQAIAKEIETRQRNVEKAEERKKEIQEIRLQGRGFQNHAEISDKDVLNQIGVTALSGLPGTLAPTAINHLISKPNFNREIPGYRQIRSNIWRGAKTGIPGKKGGLPLWASLPIGIGSGVASTGALGPTAQHNFGREAMDAYGEGFNALGGDRSTDNIGLLGVDIPLIGKPIDMLPTPGNAIAIANGIDEWNRVRHGRTHFDEELEMWTTPPPQRNSEGERVWMPAPRDINGNQMEQMIYDPNTHQISPSGELVEKPKDGWLERGLREIRRVGAENMAD